MDADPVPKSLYYSSTHYHNTVRKEMNIILIHSFLLYSKFVSVTVHNIKKAKQPVPRFSTMHYVLCNYNNIETKIVTH